MFQTRILRSERHCEILDLSTTVKLLLSLSKLYLFSKDKTFLKRGNKH